MNSALKVPNLEKQNRRALLAERLRQASTINGVAPVSFGQQRLWFLEQLEPETPLYNLATLLRIEGEVNVRALERSISTMVARHGALRTRFVVGDDGPAQ